MLTKLSIQNIALIKNINIDFHKGLNIITGETGAGKSILINSIRAVLGDRVYREMISTGSNSALIEAEFIVDSYIIEWINALGFSLKTDERLNLTREISRSGKNSCKVNGTSVTVSMLNDIGALLVDVHGQFDSRSLVSVDTHIHVIDQFGHKEISLLMDKYNAHLSEYKGTLAKLKRYAANDKELERKVDMLEYQINEIESAKLQKDEEHELIEKRDLMANAEKILNSLNAVNQLLHQGEMNASSMLSDSMSRMSGISIYKKEYQEIENVLRDITFKLEDVVFNVSGFLHDVEFNPNELDIIQDRLEAIKGLKKKYGNSVEEILTYYDNAKNELELLKNSEEIILELKEKLEEQKRKLYECALEISKERCKIAERLEERIAKELDDMEMKKVTFKTSIIFPDYENVNENDFTENGLDFVEFLISPNQGEELKPLAKIASGGEMSRIMLAIKTLLSDRNKIPVMIFDEIDTGISGEAALKTGRKIYDIARNCQVICVTHMPQIAGLADNHYIIKKENKNGNMFTTINEINVNDRIDQLASMLDGNTITEFGRKHAKDMLEKADEYKMKSIFC